MPSATPTLPQRHPPPSHDRALAVARRLRIGEAGYVDGIGIRRTSLLTYRVAGFALDLDEIPTEVAYLAAERLAIRQEPSLVRAGELAARGGGVFKVRLERVVAGQRFYEATWTSGDWRSTARDDRAVLDELVVRARDLGMQAQHVGYKVVASVPRPFRRRAA